MTFVSLFKNDFSTEKKKSFIPVDSFLENEEFNWLKVFSKRKGRKAI